MNNRRKAFSLMELLLVVAILFILLSLLLPAGIALRERSKIKRAAAEAQLIVKGVQAYRSVYGKWPCQAQGAQDMTYGTNSTVMQALATNPRGITFIQAPVNPNTDEFTDPWDRSYIIAMDCNEDGNVNLVLSAPISTNVTIRNETAAVMSLGPDPINPSKRVCSWAP